MRAVIELTSMLDKPERECDPAFRKYRNVLSLWNATLSGIHAWDNTSDTEALGRLVIMSLNSGMLLDETFDDSLSQSYLYYKRKLGNEKIPLLALPYLLELELENKITNGQGTDMHMIGVIRETALESMKDCTLERDDYWLLLSVLTECICTEQLDACCNSICM